MTRNLARWRLAAALALFIGLLSPEPVSATGPLYSSVGYSSNSLPSVWGSAVQISFTTMWAPSGCMNFGASLEDGGGHVLSGVRRCYGGRGGACTPDGTYWRRIETITISDNGCYTHGSMAAGAPAQPFHVQYDGSCDAYGFVYGWPYEGGGCMDLSRWAASFAEEWNFTSQCGTWGANGTFGFFWWMDNAGNWNPVVPGHSFSSGYLGCWTKQNPQTPSGGYHVTK